MMKTRELFGMTTENGTLERMMDSYRGAAGICRSDYYYYFIQSFCILYIVRARRQLNHIRYGKCMRWIAKFTRIQCAPCLRLILYAHTAHVSPMGTTFCKTLAWQKHLLNEHNENGVETWKVRAAYTYPYATVIEIDWMNHLARMCMISSPSANVNKWTTRVK